MKLSQPSGCVFCMELTATTAYILAGGQSQRLEQDKLFIKCGKQSLLSRTVQTCLHLFDTVKIVAKEKNKFQGLNCDVIIDWPHADGPLAGIIAAMHDCQEECCFIIAADLYDLNPETIASLRQTYAGEDYLGILEHGYPQPLCGIYNKSALDVLLSQAAANHYRVQDALARLHYRLIPYTGKNWRNINTPRDLELIKGNYD